MSENPSYDALVQSAIATAEMGNSSFTEDGRQSFILAAGANATLALAEQQRIANLISLAALLQQRDSDESLTAERKATVDSLETQLTELLLSNGH